MDRKLFILRHAKSAWDTDASSDFDRPLAKRGERDAPAMGAWMREQNLLPEHIISSPAMRAKQTVLMVCAALDIKKKAIIWDERIYGANSDTLLEVLSEVPSSTRSVLLVGHNPGLDDLYSYLSGHTGGDAGGFDGAEYGVIKTATLAHLETKVSWRNLSAGCATEIEVKYPRDLFQAE